MTLAKNLRQSLGDPQQGTDGIVTASAGTWTATANTPHRDKIGAEINELTVERDAPGPGSVKAWADQFTGSNTGLLEPLKVQEVDTKRDEALIRSSPPAAGESGGTDYYEVKMQGTQKASVKRYHAEDGKRESVPFNLTHESIGKLVDGLTGSQPHD